MEKILTIVVPSYNVEQYLVQTLDSFTKCKLHEMLDVIIVNDGSKDDTLQVAERYKDKYKTFVSVIDKVNGGHGSTINSGLKKSVGKFFCVMDGDDWGDSNTLDELIQFLTTCREDIVITGHFRNYINTGKEEKYKYNEESGTVHQLGYLLEKGYLIPMTDICYKTKLLNETNLKIQEHTFYVDEEYCSIPFKQAKTICFFGKGFYHYRIGAENQSISLKNTIARIDHKVRVLDRIYKTVLEETAIAENREYIRRKLIGVANSILLINYVYLSDKKEGYKKGEEFYENICNSYPLLQKECKKINKAFSILNKLHVNEPIWSFYQRLKHKTRR